MFKKIIIAAIVAVTAMAYPVMADSLVTIDTSKITSEQFEQIKNIANSDSTKNIVEDISSYAQVGKDIGVGIAEAAKQLGMAAAEFANTPAGMVAISVIVWKVILSGMFTSIALFGLGIFWVVFAYRTYNKLMMEKKDNIDSGEWTVGLSLLFFVSLIPSFFFFYNAVA